MADVKRIPSGKDDIFLIDGQRYLAPFNEKDPVVKLEEFSLVTVINIPEDMDSLAEEWLRSTVNTYTNRDDVFITDFLAGVVFNTICDVHLDVTPVAKDYLKANGNQWFKTLCSPELLPGPYANVDGQLRDVWKIEDDTSGTCMAALRPWIGNEDQFETFHSISTNGHFPTFPLRSRLKAPTNPTSPIAGWRIVLKDNIDLSGVKTTLGNRAYHDLYPPRSKTADTIQKLIDRGVVVCGKTKMNSFGNWEESTEYVDYQAPWNPRGDGYQSTGGSSSGSAAAIAAYEWLDIAIGTDSWGSITRPALWCGCFALRPSIGAASTSGIEPYVPTWDIPGIMGRDISKFRVFAGEWLLADGLVEDPKPFTAIIWASDFWELIDENQVQASRKFVSDVEKLLSLRCEDVSFEAEWKRAPPAEAEGCPLPEFINTALSALAYDIYHSEDDFRKRYKREFGRDPYTSPVNRQVWSLGSKITKEERDAGFQKIAVYEAWFKNTILSGQRQNALIIQPQENMLPRYRDVPPNFKRPPKDGISSLALAAVLKAPCLSVPIGQITYKSRVSGNTEYLPFVVSLISPQGTDLHLIDIVKTILETSGRPTSVLTGKVMFDVSKRPETVIEGQRQ